MGGKAVLESQCPVHPSLCSLTRSQGSLVCSYSIARLSPSTLGNRSLERKSARKESWTILHASRQLSFLDGAQRESEWTFNV